MTLRLNKALQAGLAVSMLLLAQAANAADVYYPGYRKDPRPPISTVEPIDVRSGHDPSPACVAVRYEDECDDPAGTPADVGLDDEAV